MQTPHEQHYDQDRAFGNPEADEVYAKAMEEIESARERFYKAIPCEHCTLMVPRPSMTEHVEFYCTKRSKGDRA